MGEVQHLPSMLWLNCAALQLKLYAVSFSDKLSWGSSRTPCSAAAQFVCCVFSAGSPAADNCSMLCHPYHLLLCHSTVCNTQLQHVGSPLSVAAS
jgi:hypothetical protein